jgi:hypothetical protein
MLNEEEKRSCYQTFAATMCDVQPVIVCESGLTSVRHGPPGAASRAPARVDSTRAWFAISDCICKTQWHPLQGSGQQEYHETLLQVSRKPGLQRLYRNLGQQHRSTTVQAMDTGKERASYSMGQRENQYQYRAGNSLTLARNVSNARF